jgi:hypothetical protein
MGEGREFLERAAASGAGDRAGVLKGLGTIAFRQGDSTPPTAPSRSGMSSWLLRRRSRTPTATWPGWRSGAATSPRCGSGLSGATRRRSRSTIRLPSGSASTCGPQPIGWRATSSRARELYLRSIELNEQLGNEVNVAGENHNLVHVELRSGNRDEARRRFAAASEWIFAHDNEYMRPYVFLDAGVLALQDGDDERACRLVACADRIFRDTDAIPDPDDFVELEKAVATLRERLGERFDGTWAEGRELSEERAQELARASG